MFETLSRGFKTAQEKLTGKTQLDASNIQDAMQDVRRSLLEADVEFGVVKGFLQRVEDKAVGELVHTRVNKDGSQIQVTPAEHFINICHTELEALMGPVRSRNPISQVKRMGVRKYEGRLLHRLSCSSLGEGARRFDARSGAEA